MANQIPPDKLPKPRPTKIDKVLMIYYDEYSMNLQPYGKNDYRLYEKASDGHWKYLGVIEKKVITEDPHFKEWFSRKKAQSRQRKKQKENS